MRILLATATAASLVAIAACGQGSAFDNGLRDSYREKALSSCVSGARSAAPAGVTIDFDRVCGCAIDRHMEGKSGTELMRENEKTDMTGAQAAMTQCLNSELRRTGAMPGGAAPEGPAAAGGDNAAKPAE